MFKVNDFHVTEYFSVDVMHDVLKDVSIYVLKSVLFIFIFVKNILISITSIAEFKIQTMVSPKLLTILLSLVSIELRMNCI